MAAQAKHFIELSDIEGLRVACGKCGAVASVPIAQLKNDGKRFQCCPGCGATWATDISSTVCEFAAQLKSGISDTLKKQGVSLSLELSESASAKLASVSLELRKV